MAIEVLAASGVGTKPAQQPALRELMLFRCGARCGIFAPDLPRVRPPSSSEGDRSAAGGLQRQRKYPRAPWRKAAGKPPFVFPFPAGASYPVQTGHMGNTLDRGHG